MSVLHCPICSYSSVQYFTTLKMYRYYTCRNCKTLFTNPSITQKKLTAYYQKHFHYVDGLLNEHIIRKRARIILQNIINKKGAHISLCDVGSGYGFFLDCAQQSLTQVYGIEPSRILAKSSIDTFNIPVFIGTSREYMRSQNFRKFDVVTSIHVIEHVANPKNHIRELLTLLKPDGLLYVETPNLDSYLFYAENKKYTFLLAPEHPWIFSHYSFRYLIQDTKRALTVKTYSYSEHVMGIIKAIIKKYNSSATVPPKNLKKPEEISLSPSSQISILVKKAVFYFIFDLCLAKLFVPFLNMNHKGSILELYISKK